MDTSAVLAVFIGERGADQVIAPGRCLHLSMVNLAEVYTKVAERGGKLEDVDEWLRITPIRIRAFREAHAMEVGRLRPLTRRKGLSLGDRACLALGLLTGFPVLTSDTKWLQLDLGVEVVLIR